jgi:hypothetical protein
MFRFCFAKRQVIDSRVLLYFIFVFELCKIIVPTVCGNLGAKYRYIRMAMRPTGRRGRMTIFPPPGLLRPPRAFSGASFRRGCMT